MMRPQIKYAALLLLLLCGCVAPAQAAMVRVPGDSLRRFSRTVPAPVVAVLAVAPHGSEHVAAAMLAYTLPPEPKPTTHWPWWLRILAVIGVLVFIRIVAGSVRSKPSGPGPV